MNPLFKSLFSFLLIIANAKTCFAAACCGGGFAAPSIIVGDDEAQLTTSLSATEIIIDNVDSNGIWRKSSSHQTVQTFRLEGAHIFQDRWQVGFGLPIMQRTYRRETYSGLGDLIAALGYEYLPDWDYNPIRPKGIGFLQLTIPTGKSKADSDVGGLDSRGNGFWSVSAGTILTKSWFKWDAFASIELHRSFSKQVDSNSFEGKLNPGLGSNFGLGAGYNLKDYRFGTSLTWTSEDPVVTISDSGTRSNGYKEQFATAVASCSYLASDDWSGTFSYNDQTIIGNPLNTSLGRGVSFQIQRRWGR